ncbi:hypothetical protein CANCADRAFT_30516 [Tortispora caseinolytica NRRL Y-17796]|uniref:Uncharacterized protein n=1 Tax=Tortispora caseinolytica NRRL Y-17796 TaxID=767744 RepID=A0A1E4TKQ5_9ASCO|nr:hypothetical protein CANCADRAFT_30516 [Tortispora caseinolytica NRRL Y-17796]
MSAWSNIAVYSPLLLIAFAYLRWTRAGVEAGDGAANTDRGREINEPAAEAHYDVPADDAGSGNDVPVLATGNALESEMDGVANDGAGTAGPSVPRTKKIGKKKAKSIARKDQVKQYNEYMRTMSIMERERQQADDEQFREVREYATQRRREIEEDLEKRREQARHRAKETEEAARTAYEGALKRLRDVRPGERVKVDTDALEKAAYALTDGSSFVTSQKYFIRLTEDQISLIRSRISSKGYMSYEDILKELNSMF